MRQNTLPDNIPNHGGGGRHLSLHWRKLQVALSINATGVSLPCRLKIVTQQPQAIQSRESLPALTFLAKAF